MLAKYPVLNTRLYERLAAVLPKNRHRKLRDNLQKVWSNGTSWARANDSISMAFTWRNTPQGYDFWRELWYYEKYGWERGRRMWIETSADN